MLIRVVVAGAASIVWSGCALMPTPEPSFPVPPRFCEFPIGTELAFAGNWTLEEAGLIGGQPEHRQAVGMLYVTADRIPVLSDPSPNRQYCMTYPPSHVDGGPVLTLGSVPDGWVPPLSR
jgi:hypothetical protein